LEILFSFGKILFRQPEFTGFVSSEKKNEFLASDTQVGATTIPFEIVAFFFFKLLKIP